MDTKFVVTGQTDGWMDRESDYIIYNPLRWSICRPLREHVKILYNYLLPSSGFVYWIPNLT